MYSLLCQNHLSHSPEGEIVCLDRLIQMVAHLLLTWFKVHPAFLSVELCTSSGASTRRCSIASICSEVQRCISRAIDEVSETLHCSRKAEFSFGFFCPENVGIGQSPHPAIVNFLDSQPCNLRCPLTHGRPCLPDSSLVWFSEDSLTLEQDRGILRSPIARGGPHGVKLTMANLTSLQTAEGDKIEIIETVAPKWKTIGNLMDFDPDGRKVNLIEADREHAHRRNGLLACCQEIFKLWLLREDATWEKLNELLIDSGHKVLAEQVMDAVGLSDL